MSNLSPVPGATITFWCDVCSLTYNVVPGGFTRCPTCSTWASFTVASDGSHVPYTMPPLPLADAALEVLDGRIASQLAAATQYVGPPYPTAPEVTGLPEKR